MKSINSIILLRTKIEITKLRTGATNLEILDAMKNSPDGIGFLNHTQSLPSYTFVSTDACTWLLDHLEGVTSIEAACVIMKQMLKDRLICHASGDFDKPFIIGFYLYYIVPQEKDQKGIHLIHTTIHKHEAYMSVHYLSDYIQPLFDLESFENEWMEVGIKFPNKSESQEHESSKESQVAHFLRDVIVSPVLEDQEYDGTFFFLLSIFINMYKPIAFYMMCIYVRHIFFFLSKLDLFNYTLPFLNNIGNKILTNSDVSTQKISDSES